ncbi:MAG: beta-phosphoglucomutase family hydrolase [Vicinamibacterales bacterium]|jgi:alpha,alpha-trehalase|nr:beta-phosphoglucomutase family hydrolase [Vicinamibacterales bacterium]
MDWTKLDAALFDLDGVLVKTTELHASCWGRMFDAFLSRDAARRRVAYQTFDVRSDYTRYVDGKPRDDGVRDFLASRGITLPDGEPGDPPERESVHGLGNRKAALFLEAIETGGVEVYEGALALIRHLRRVGLKTAVVSSSRNCETILRVVGMLDQFDVRIDGERAVRLGLAGKPAPDTFLEAARRLDVEPGRAAVIEDAIAGIEAGRAGHFGLVIGVDHRARRVISTPAGPISS